jgi:hypothetical protein
VIKAKWPKLDIPLDLNILAAAQYIRDVVHRTRSAEEALQRKRAKGKKGSTGPSSADASSDGPRTIRIFYSTAFPEWQENALAALKTTWDDETGKFTGMERDALVQAGLANDKRVMPFISTIKVCIVCNLEKTNLWCPCA